MADQQSFAQLRAYDTNGNPVAGAKAYFYLTGTLTLTTVYSDEALTIPHPSPLVADAGGGFAQVFANGAVKCNVTTSSGGVVPNYPIDPCWRSAGNVSSASQVTFTPTANIPNSDVQAAIVAVDTNSRTRDTSEAGLRAAADALLAPLASPTFTGVPAAPTAVALTSTTQLATTAFVTTAVAAIPSSSYVEVSGSPFTLTAASPFNVTGLSAYKDILVIGDQITATVAGNRQLRIGNSGGVLATAIYAQISGANATESQMSDSAAGARSFSFEVLNFNTTNAVKPVRMMANQGTSTWTQMISSATAFDRIQLLNSVAATFGGTLRVFGRV